ncbi:MAG: class II fructose-bisphosphate aldolase [Anaerolineales bacterium]|nr:MAG: class II fructose-bisphosphate aldolase [Anaerolineales bacterium]
MQSVSDIINNAKKAGVAIPAFNVPYLPMVEPVIRAVVDQDSFALIETARLEWVKFESQGPAAVMEEFMKWNESDYVRIHLDHVPVIDEDNLRVDYLSIIREAIELGYQSVMVDGSRLDLEGNIEATGQVVDLAHKAGIPCEAELGAVLGHEAGPLPPYEELFESGRGFTDVKEAERFVRETGCDWLSVAIGNIHGAVSGALKDKKKVEARLNLEHLEKLRQATGVPLVLHGGSGVKREYLLAAIKKGIAKVNIGTEIRQAYESALRESGSVAAAQEAVCDRTRWLIRDYFGLAGTRGLVVG